MSKMTLYSAQTDILFIFTFKSKCPQSNFDSGLNNLIKLILKTQEVRIKLQCIYIYMYYFCTFNSLSVNLLMFFLYLVMPNLIFCSLC